VCPLDTSWSRRNPQHHTCSRRQGTYLAATS
jgi:hypothetical protein